MPSNYCREMKVLRMLISSHLIFLYQLWKMKMTICFIYLENEHGAFFYFTKTALPHPFLKASNSFPKF